ncbi:hypothetical protein C8D87_12210 [Lentzea atacamensis]|uniref:Uncharacterized protein n=1 Tax=Lentzea atacamensis TaxID=531938 RepID=A0ABX9DWG3_9PSEU|nr:hypothetical protein [Lentzea atacamensis]RAS57151.1 hypothetical protein C8D87_12210 [Lentzea atacamensis]
MRNAPSTLLVGRQADIRNAQVSRRNGQGDAGHRPGLHLISIPLATSRQSFMDEVEFLQSLVTPKFGDVVELGQLFQTGPPSDTPVEWPRRLTSEDKHRPVRITAVLPRMGAGGVQHVTTVQIRILSTDSAPGQGQVSPRPMLKPKSSPLNTPRGLFEPIRDSGSSLLQQVPHIC